MVEPGTLIGGRYEVLSLLGQGAMASVYRVRHRALGSEHALKLIHPELAEDTDLRARFLDEGRIQAQLRHPNIIAVTDLLEGDWPGLIMELVEGPRLDELIDEREGAVETDRMMEIMLPVLDAVGHAHSQGIVHRDLKPENILVATGPDGRPSPKVGDFGIARILEDAQLAAAHKATRAGMRMGTLLYMSPEQVHGLPDLGPASDIFSLGAILFELVTGELAFRGDSEFQTMKRIVEGSYTPPERFVGDLDLVLAACIRTALATRPEERFASCAEFAHHLTKVGSDTLDLPLRPSRSLADTTPPELVLPSTPTLEPLPTAIPAPDEATPLPATLRPVLAPPTSMTPVARDHLEHQTIPPANSSSPWMSALLNVFCFTGLGQALNRQYAKGMAIFVVHAIGFLFGGWAITIPLAAADAWCIARKRRDGKWVGPWEWF